MRYFLALLAGRERGQHLATVPINQTDLNATHQFFKVVLVFIDYTLSKKENVPDCSN